MADMIISRQLLENAITNELTSVEDSATVHLSSSSVPFSDTTTVTGVLSHEPSYPGYAPQEWDLTPIALDGNQYDVVEGTLIFDPPTSGPSVVLYGYAVLYTSSDSVTYVLGGADFDDTIGMKVGDPSLAVILNLSDLDLNNP